MEHHLDELTSRLRRLAIDQQQLGHGGSQLTPRSQVCGICASPGHPTASCPTLAEESQDQVLAAGGDQGRPYQQEDRP